MSKKLNREIREFLENGILSVSLEREIRNMIELALKETANHAAILKVFGSKKAAVDEIFQEVMGVFWEKRNEILERKIENLVGYVKISVKNRIVDHLKSGWWKKKVSLDSKLNSDEDEKSFTETIPIESDSEDPLEEFVAKMMFKHMKDVFKGKEKDLCDLFYKKTFSDEDADIFSSGKSTQARYKSHERLAKKLRDFVEKNDLTRGEFAALVKIYMSEICEKIRPDMVRDERRSPDSGGADR
uniref:Uncharacterized protein n=1 Tax=Pseudothermotoga hypogea TaxID=57487 RepID=A0A832I414_9THEM